MEEEKKTHLKRAGYGWLVVVILVLLGSSILKEYRQRRFDPEIGMNIAVVGDKKLGIMTVRKEEDMSSFVILPEKLVVDIEKTGSKLRVGSLWGLGKLEGQPGNVVMRQAGRALALGISGYIKVNNDDQLEPAKIAGDLIQLNIKTNLSWWDRINLRQEIKATLARGEMPITKINETIYQTQVDPDGVENLIIDREKLKMWAERVWMTPEVLGERVNIAVYNNSDRDGKAREMADALEVAGARVINVDKDGESTNSCEFIVHRKDLIKTPLILEKQFGCRPGKFGSKVGEGRADIEILTGKD